MRIVVVIPIYKAEPSHDELLSLRQCIKVLSNYTIYLVHPHELDTSSYDFASQNKLHKLSFAPSYFDGIEGYNRLMKSNMFYEHFCDFEYMLIYQLDAWVFRDELKEWCKRGYDYVGAPWFKHFRSHEEGYNLWRVGNGGLSLRRIKKFLECTQREAPVYSFWSLLRQGGSHFFRNLIRYIRYPNNMGWFIDHCASTWEDGFFCIDLAETIHSLKVPKPEEAAMFSFECSPEFLFEKVTQRKLPFGCHAWRRYHFDEFWKQHIPTTSNAG